MVFDSEVGCVDMGGVVFDSALPHPSHHPRPSHRGHIRENNAVSFFALLSSFVLQTGGFVASCRAHVSVVSFEPIVSCLCESCVLACACAWMSSSHFQKLFVYPCSEEPK